MNNFVQAIKNGDGFKKYKVYKVYDEFCGYIKIELDYGTLDFRHEQNFKKIETKKYQNKS